MKNWKSTLAFFVFVGVYVWSVSKGMGEGIVETAGYVALYSSVFMMMRSEMTTELLGKVVDNMKFGK